MGPVWASAYLETFVGWHPWADVAGSSCLGRTYCAPGLGEGCWRPSLSLLTLTVQGPEMPGGPLGWGEERTAGGVRSCACAGVAAGSAGRREQAGLARVAGAVPAVVTALSGTDR